MDIGVWGDSITYGAGDALGLGWVGRLRKHLYESDREVYNRGICGDTSADLLERFDTEVQAIKPGIIMLAVGINDSKVINAGGDQRVPLDTFKQNMRGLITKAQLHANKVVIIGLTEINETQRKRSNETIHEYDHALAELAKSTGITFVSMRGVIDPNTDLEDGLHPNAGGYEKMFNVIAPLL